MYELSLYSGAGGGLLGTKLLGWTCTGYVEINDYCQKVIAQRIKDGILDRAPIFGDIKTFLIEGYAESYSGMVDVITAGFPCQPFSVAGKGKGESDERNMWPETRDCISRIRPPYVFLENVPGLFADRYIQRIFGELAALGYDCKWKIVSASQVGAPHLRERIWIVAHPQSTGDRKFEIPFKRKDAATQGRSLEPNKQSGNGGDGIFTNPNSQRLEREDQPEMESYNSTRQSWWAFEPAVGRMAHGSAHRVDRLKAIGNGQVPEVVRTAWEILTSGD